MNGQRRGSLGFTLIEILITVAIVVILVAVAIPSLSNALSKTRRSVCDANKEIVRRGLIMDLMLESASTSAEKATIVDAGMADLGAEKVGTRYIGLCPCGGEYSISFAGTISASSPSEENAADKVFITCSEHDITTWASGVKYEADELMCAEGYIFKCLRTHTSGSGASTRNPAVRSNKATWEVIGYTGGTLEYYSVVRYKAGLEVTYNGHIYARTDHDPNGGQTPFSNSSSPYWTLISN